MSVQPNLANSVAPTPKLPIASLSKKALGSSCEGASKSINCGRIDVNDSPGIPIALAKFAISENKESLLICLVKLDIKADLSSGF